MSHGYNVKKNTPDPLINLVETAAQDFYIATTKVWLVDIFPWLRHMPLWLPFHRAAAKYRQTNINQVEIPHEFVKRQMVRSSNMREASYEPSFTSQHLCGLLSLPEEHSLKHAANALYGGGTDTVAATLSSFFLAMVLYPDVQKRAQQEIDDAIGRFRLPTFSDNDRLPYLTAVYKEVLRWHPIGPMGIPHAVMEDDMSIANDPQNYENPTQFNPDRFYNVNGKGSTTLDPHEFAFGFGRRKCPGQDLADANVWICMAMSLSVFDFSGDGSEAPRAEFTSSTVSAPKPFRCTIKARSADAMAVLQAIESEISLLDDNASAL
ncbi:hypothetical protein EW026_g8263 [Hermanssonia centrifuga]|uniref:Cytochrome P450 n=1 Tax=Hermanssonia centrifuga TaxID=98765 RepID=A0A4S4K4S1_9APHY|nr:hypothetical protein EW026_g8263 [Hermanssonia centrifuga]